MDISLPSSVPQNNSINLDLLGGTNSQKQTSSNIAEIFSIDLGLNQSPNKNNGQGNIMQTIYQQPVYPQPIYQQPVYPQTIYQQPVYQQPAYQQNGSDQFLFNSGLIGQPAQLPIYSNITLNE